MSLGHPVHLLSCLSTYYLAQSTCYVFESPSQPTLSSSHPVHLLCLRVIQSTYYVFESPSPPTMSSSHPFHLLCKFVTFMENVVGNASRHRVAFRSSTATTSICNVCRSFLTIWLTSFLGAFPMLFITQFTQATYVDENPLFHSLVILHIPDSMLFNLYLLTVCQVYMKLMMLFRREQEMSLNYPGEIVRLKRQMTQIIITVVLVFFICHTPFRTIALWSMFSPPHAAEGIDFITYITMIYMTRILWYSNHAINPFVYNFVSRKFRRALIWLCCEKRRKHARLEELRDLVCAHFFFFFHFLRMDSLKQHRQSTAGRLYDIDNNIRDKEREDQETMDRHSHFLRNDFLVLYEHLLLE
ncbi:unnamed protein product [Candidula unifasciata]|uniref:G-protein coupled receptors family 1 profile domain-containing protein n=1 Tax=Candidula unifasciata TaxID=100452 RepID=A0A8S3Z0W3_9EUPU|nr:unnamed protein product [Candidula unifasciata]